MRAGSDGEKKLKDASFEKGYNTSTEIQNDPSLSHLDQHGDARMVSVSNKAHTKRIAVAVCSVRFSVAGLTTMIERHLIKKGDVLSVARVAGIMGAKLTANIIPLCHPIPLTHVHVNTKLISPQCRKSSSDQPRKTEDFGMGQYGGVMIEARVECVGQTGVEMEALCAANIAGMTIYDMCKGVDKHMCIDGSLVVLKRGGASPDWTAPGWRPLGDVKGHDGDREDMIHDTS